jgi:hypothetical protein
MVFIRKCLGLFCKMQVFEKLRYSKKKSQQYISVHLILEELYLTSIIPPRFDVDLHNACIANVWHFASVTDTALLSVAVSVCVDSVLYAR